MIKLALTVAAVACGIFAMVGIILISIGFVLVAAALWISEKMED